MLGILTLFVARWAINDTHAADYVVGPLLRADTPGAAEAIVVPGGSVTAACTPNQNSLQRTLRAVRLFRAGRAPYVVFAGAGSEGTRCPVASVMAGLAAELGVPRDRIRVEETSNSTHDNALRSDAVLQALGARRILLVTDRLHMRRAEGCYAKLGYAVERSSVPIYDGHVDNVSMLAAGLREYVGWWSYRLRGYVTVPSAPGGASTPVLTLWPPPQLEGEIAAGTSLAHPDGPIVLIGASYAAGWKNLVAPGREIVNVGVSGQQSFELLNRFDADVISRRPRAVIIWGFINDIFNAKRAELDKAMARTQRSIIEMTVKARANGIEPILATEVTIRRKAGLTESLASVIGPMLGKSAYYDYVNRHVLDGNAWLRELATRQNIMLLDLQPVVSDRFGRRRAAYGQSDGSHITELGYNALSHYAQPRLAAHFAASRPAISSEDSSSR